ncbi:hypothetical protein FACS1894214_2560 [Planctomycetales bacterium]|nr:hypothetical protein FACS1894214_2560 [Planctomycetales bacterium]
MTMNRTLILSVLCFLLTFSLQAEILTGTQDSLVFNASENSPYLIFDMYASSVDGIESYGQGDTFDAVAAQKFYDDRAVKQFVSSWHFDASKAVVLPGTVNPTDAPKLSGELVRGDWSGEADFNFTLGSISEGSPNLSLFQELNPVGFTYEGKYPTLHADQTDGFIHMVAFDVTDLFQAAFQDMFQELSQAGLQMPQIESAYMIAWETGREDGRRDFSYSDYNQIVINVSPNYSSAPTPEPATMLIFGLGTLAAGACYRRRRK